MPRRKSQFGKADYFDFSRGIVRGISQYKGRPNFVKKADNVIFRPAKAMKVRGGYRAASTALCPEEPTSLAKYYTTTGQNFIFVGTDSSEGLETTGELMRANLDSYVNQNCFDETNTPIVLTGKRWRFAQVNGCLVGTQDGATFKPIFFRAESDFPNTANTWISVHMTKPTTAPTAVVSAGGGVDEGTHFYRVRWRYFNGASEHGPSLKIFGGPTVISGSNLAGAILVTATTPGSFLGLLPGMQITAGPAGTPYTIATVATNGNTLTTTLPIGPAYGPANYTFDWPVGSRTISLGNIPINPAGRTDYIGWTLERTKADNIGGESGKWYVVSDGTLANYVDTVADNLLFTEVDEGVYGQCPAVDGVIAYKNRMVAWRGTTIYASEPIGGTDGTGLFNFDPLNYYPVEKDDGDKIQTIILQADRLLVFKKRAVFAFEGEDENSFRVIAVYDGAGAAGIRCAASYGNSAIFYSGEAGIFKVEGNAVTPFGWLEVGDYKEDFDPLKRDRAIVFNYLGEYIILSYKSKDTEFPEDCLVFDLRYGNWTHWAGMRIADVVVSKDISDFSNAQFLYADPKEFGGGAEMINQGLPAYHAHRFGSASLTPGTQGVKLTKVDTGTLPAFNPIPPPVAEWTANVDTPLNVHTQLEYMSHTIVSCPDGSVNVFWSDRTDGAGGSATGDPWSIWGQKIAPDGTKQWAAGGVRISAPIVSAAPNKETYGWVTAVGDGAGGSYVGYMRFAPGTPVNATAIVRHIDNAGAVLTNEAQLASAPGQNMPQGVILFFNDATSVYAFVTTECGGSFGRKWFANEVVHALGPNTLTPRWSNIYGGRAVHPSAYTAAPDFTAVYNDRHEEQYYSILFNKAQRQVVNLDEGQFAVLFNWQQSNVPTPGGPTSQDQFKIRYFDFAKADADPTAVYATTATYGLGTSDGIFHQYQFKPVSLTPDESAGCWAMYAHWNSYPDPRGGGVKAYKFSASGVLEFNPVDVASTLHLGGGNNTEFLSPYGFPDGQGGLYCIYTQCVGPPLNNVAPYVISVTRISANGVFVWNPTHSSLPLQELDISPNDSSTDLRGVNSFPISDGAGGVFVYYMGKFGVPSNWFFNLYHFPSSGPPDTLYHKVFPIHEFGSSESMGVGDWASYHGTKAFEHLAIESGFKLQSGLDGFGDERDNSGTGGSLTPVVVEFHDSDDGYPDYFKDFDRICVHIRSGNAVTIDKFNMTANIDTLEGGGVDAATFVVSQSGPLWNQFFWNQAIWGGSVVSILESGWRNGTVGRRYRLRFSGGASTDITIHGFTMDSFMLPERSYSR